MASRTQRSEKHPNHRLKNPKLLHRCYDELRRVITDSAKSAALTSRSALQMDFSLDTKPFIEINNARPIPSSSAFERAFCLAGSTASRFYITVILSKRKEQRNENLLYLGAHCIAGRGFF
jgi:hypothetical protein